jgi:hypothetical protein
LLSVRVLGGSYASGEPNIVSVAVQNVTDGPVLVVMALLGWFPPEDRVRFT